MQGFTLTSVLGESRARVTHLGKKICALYVLLKLAKEISQKELTCKLLPILNIAYPENRK